MEEWWVDGFTSYYYFPVAFKLQDLMGYLLGIVGLFHVNFQEGDFEMKHIDMVGSPTFNIAIAPFSLTILEDENHTII